jgi:hypothetical protein
MKQFFPTVATIIPTRAGGADNPWSFVGTEFDALRRAGHRWHGRKPYELRVAYGDHGAKGYGVVVPDSSGAAYAVNGQLPFTLLAPAAIPRPAAPQGPTGPAEQGSLERSPQKGL